MADDRRHLGRPPERSGPRHPLRQRREEEMGRQLRLHGPLCLRRRHHLLGHLGLQDVLRREAPPFLGKSRARSRPEVPPHAGGAPRHRPLLQQRRRRDRRVYSSLPHGFHGVVPVRICGDHADTPGGVAAGANELHGVDGFRAAVADLLLYGGGFQSLGRRLSVPVGSHGLFRRLRHPPLFRHCRFNRRLLGN
ncbi:unnamed protein product [Cuscuta epithymum]|uniref:Uncharacterized protein n=1 Tax=Cuscuta epithymum TaxID=186058 RepID=A0AAV0CA81_9ASTE|nr:unnamed protein product [Cuscuta epithymum]